MSACREAKNELSKVKVQAECCRKAEVYGLLLFSRLCDGVVFRTEYENAVRRIAEDIASYCSVYVDIAFPGRCEGKKLCAAAIQYEQQRALVKEKFKTEFDEAPEGIAQSVFQNDCCRYAFLRGAFLAAGVLYDPEKECRIEFCTKDETLCSDFARIVSGWGYKCTVSHRRGSFVAIIKDGESLEEMLGMMGATKSAMEIMGGRIVRDIRNTANRQKNCDTANIGKSVAAAKAQIAAIEKIENTYGLSTLSPELEELARLRLENTDMPLSELGGLLSTPLSKSGVNHRLRRIIEIAEGIDEK